MPLGIAPCDVLLEFVGLLYEQTAWTAAAPVARMAAPSGRPKAAGTRRQDALRS
jgi:hypothetical protein